MDLKSLGSRHGEKLALGAAVLLFIGYFVYSAMFSGEDPAQKGVMGQVESINEKLGSAEPPTNPKLRFSQDLDASWRKLVPPEPANNWVAYHPTTFEKNLVKVVVEGPHTLLAPKASGATVDFGKITFTWEADDRSTAEANGYEVARKGGPDKDWRTVTSDPIEATCYDDSDVVPKTTYSYRVRAITEDKKAKGRESEWSGEVSATAKGVIELRMTIAAAALASIEVRKFVRGKWETYKYSVKKGDKIGQVEKRREDNKVVTVDMTTGYTLVDIKQEKRKRTRKVPYYETEDGVRIQKEKEVVEEISEWKIIYKDDEGKTFDLWREDSSGGGGGGEPKKTDKGDKGDKE